MALANRAYAHTALRTRAARRFHCNLRLRVQRMSIKPEDRFDAEYKAIQAAKRVDPDDPDRNPCLEWQERVLILEEALRKIAGGHFEGASRMAVEGDWKNMYREVQKIAVKALDDE